MKNTLLLIVAIIFSSGSFLNAQEVLAKNLGQVSGFVSLDQMMSTYDKKIAFDQGASAGIIFNQSFYFGGFASATLAHANDNLNTLEDFDCYEPTFGSTGLMLGYVFTPEKLLHFNVNAKFGIGALAVDTRDGVIGEYYHGDENVYEAVFMVQPNAGLELNIAKFFKINANVGYRYVGGIDEPGFDDQILNGMTGQIGLVLGWFGQKKNKNVEDPESKQMKL